MLKVGKFLEIKSAKLGQLGGEARHFDPGKKNIKKYGILGFGKEGRMGDRI